MLALTLRDTGDRGAALQAIDEALEITPESDRPGLEALRRELRARRDG